jgi:hypothetical protein
MRTYFIVMVLALCFISCDKRPEVLPTHEYIGWVETEENGLKKTKEMDGINYTVYYIPKEAMVLRELSDTASQQEWNAALEAKGNMQYFKLVCNLTHSNQDILKYNLYDETEYYARTNYLAFGIDKDVYLLNGNDRLPCRIHQYTPSYGISPKAEILFAFDASASGEENITFVLEDQLFGSGMLQFEFTAEHIKNIPTIQF